MEISEIKYCNFCFFCYKTIEELSAEIPEESSQIIQKFINQINRHVINHKTNAPTVPPCLLKKLSDVDYLLNCCVKCKDLIVDFCEKYEQLKILEIELGWKLDKLTEEIKHANALPTRWMHVDNVLDVEKKSGNYYVIKKLRQCIGDAGIVNRRQSVPRVFLKRNQNLHQEVIEIGEEAINLGRNEEPPPKKPRRGDSKKPTECPKCGKTLSTRRSLKLHLETHMDPSVWRFECGYCGKKCTTKHKLRTHVRLHTGEKPYECRFCLKKYRVRHSLTFHLKNLHGDEKGLEEELRKKITVQSKEATEDGGEGVTTEKMKGENDDVLLPLKEEFDVDQVDLHSSEELNGYLDLQSNQESCLPALNLTEEMFTNKELLDNDDDEILTPDPLTLCQPELDHQNGKDFIEFKCEECGVTFKTRSSLNFHLETHKSPNGWRWECSECDDTFATQRELNWHTKGHLNQTLYRCQQCPAQYTKRKSLETHNRLKHTRHVEEKLHPTSQKLQELGAMIQQTSGPHGDTITAAPPPLECEICRKKFSSLIHKERHFKVFHDLTGNPGRNIVNCMESGCTAYFLKKSQLQFHLKLEHGKKEKKIQKFTKCFGCPICGRIYSSTRSYKHHVLTHQDPSEWDFKCETCGKKFMLQHNLNLHMRTHTKESKYECKYCGDKFRFVNSLGIHMRNFHDDEQDVKADIALAAKRSRKKKGEAAEDIEGIAISKEAEEISIPDSVEIKMQMGDGNDDNTEGENVDEVMDINLLEYNNMESLDDSFVNLEDIY